MEKTKYIFKQSGESPEFGTFTEGQEVTQTISETGLETLLDRGVIGEEEASHGKQSIRRNR